MVKYQEANGSRAGNALRAVLPARASFQERPTGAEQDLIVTLAGHDILVRWLSVGWPRQVTEALQRPPRPDLFVAPSMSPGARRTAHDGGVGWVDESGAAEIDLPYLAVAKTGNPVGRLDANPRWRPATLAVCEVLLAGCAAATVSSVVEATGLAMSTVATALKFLEGDGYLTSEIARGRDAGRHIADREKLIDAYAAAAERLRTPISVQVGVLWRDPITGAIDIGEQWTRAGLEWAATSALSAAILAPSQTELAPLEIYLTGRTRGDLRRAAAAANLPEIDGGRLLLRPFPTPATAALTVTMIGGLRSVLWPRVYADLRTTGVRGEDAAEHLREEMSP